MEAYYVINNKIPNFYIKDYGENSHERLSKVKSSYQKWLKEKVISNLQRRKVNYFFFELAGELFEKKIPLENVRAEDLKPWLDKKAKITLPDFMEFLSYAKHYIPNLDWNH